MFFADKDRMVAKIIILKKLPIFTAWGIRSEITVQGDMNNASLSKAARNFPISQISH